MILTGFIMMTASLGCLFAMVVGVLSTDLFIAIAAYGLLIIGLVTAAIGLAAFVQSRQTRH